MRIEEHLRRAERGVEDRGLRNEEPHQVLHPLDPQSSILDPALLQRVRWRSRRGLLELDIVLGRFIDAYYTRLSEAEKQAFEALLDMPDNPLWDMIAGRAERGVQEATQGDHHSLLEKIRAA